MINAATRAIFKRELKSYFSTPLGYVFLVIFLFTIGQATFEPGRGGFFLTRNASMAPFFQFIPWLLLFLVPAISMRLWAEERKSGTIELLLTLPVTIKQAVVGKFLASWIFIAIALLCTFPMVITVEYLGTPDYGVIFLGYLGSFMLGGAFLAIGCFWSAMTKNQVVSFILTTVFCYLFLMAGSPPMLDFLASFTPLYITDLVESLSILNHFESLGKGVIRIGDLWFYAVMIGGWLYGCTLLVDDNKAS